MALSSKNYVDIRQNIVSLGKNSKLAYMIRTEAVQISYHAPKEPGGGGRKACFIVASEASDPTWKIIGIPCDLIRFLTKIRKQN